jgi:outer membrane protein assembly factor BamB
MMTAGSSLAADWPQWRGPNRDGKSVDTGLLKQWPENGPPLAWRVDTLGGGYSTPSIAAGRIFGMSNRGDKEVVWALSEKDGSEIWVTSLGPAFRQQPSQGREGPACTPTVDGERLYVEGLGGNVACLQVQDGKIVWQRSLTEDLGGRRPMWSYRESPLVDGDKVVVTPGGADAIMVALNKLTGETMWKAKMLDSPAGASGAPGGLGGGRGGPGGGGGGFGGMILLDGYLYGASGGNEGGALACLDFKTGKVMWDQRQSGQRRAKGSLALADGLLYYRMEDGNIVLIEPNPKQYTERSRFQQPDRSQQPAWPHPVIANGKLYLRDQDVLLCYNIK